MVNKFAIIEKLFPFIKYDLTVSHSKIKMLAFGMFVDMAIVPTVQREMPTDAKYLFNPDHIPSILFSKL